MLACTQLEKKVALLNNKVSSPVLICNDCNQGRTQEGGGVLPT